MIAKKEINSNNKNNIKFLCCKKAMKKEDHHTALYTKDNEDYNTAE
jgi:hypothetical protein